MMILEFHEDSNTRHFSYITQNVGLHGVGLALNGSPPEFGLNSSNLDLPFGVTMGSPVVVFSPMLMAGSILIVSGIGHWISVCFYCYRNPRYAQQPQADVHRGVQRVLFGGSHVSMFVLVFVVCGVHNASAVCLLAGLETGRVALYHVVDSLNPVSNRGYAILNSKAQYTHLSTVSKENQSVVYQVMICIVIVGVFKWIALFIAIATTQVLIASVGLACALFLLDLFYFAHTTFLLCCNHRYVWCVMRQDHIYIVLESFGSSMVVWLMYTAMRYDSAMKLNTNPL